MAITRATRAHPELRRGSSVRGAIDLTAIALELVKLGSYPDHEPVVLDAALDDLIDRARILKLRAPGSEQRMRLELTALLSTKAVHTLYGASRRQSFAV